MRTDKELAITTICKKYGKIVCDRNITLATVQFSFFLFFNPPISAIQLPQFSFFYFWQYHCWNSFFSLHICHIISLSSLLLFLKISATPLLKSLISSFCQISLNNTHITNKLYFLQYSAKKLWYFSSRKRELHDHLYGDGIPKRPKWA